MRNRLGQNIIPRLLICRVMCAVRVARYNTGKKLIVLFGGAYHGWWDGMQPAAGNERTPVKAIIYAERDVPVRTAKMYSKFRSDTLQHMLRAQRILCNMVLFRCKICNERFCTFHPDHEPDVKLDVVSAYPCAVATWDQRPGAERTKYATCGGVASDRERSNPSIGRVGTLRSRELQSAFPVVGDERRRPNQ